MKAITFLFLLAFAVGCKKSDPGTVNTSAATNILLLDEKGNNLLLSSGGVDAQDIQLYYVTEGKPVSAYNGLMDASQGFEIIKDRNGREVLRVYLNINQDKYPLTLIRFSDSDTDTIKAEFNKKNGSILCSRIWYNEVIKWDVADSLAGEEHFTVVK